MFFLLDSPQNRLSSPNAPPTTRLQHTTLRQRTTLRQHTTLPHSPLPSFLLRALLLTQYGHVFALFRYRSIRALNRPISLPLNTGSGSPMCSLRCAHTARNAALSRPLGLNTGSKSPYCLRNTGSKSPYFATAQYGLWLTYVLTSLRAYGSQRQPFHAPCSLGSVKQIVGLWLSKPSCALRKMQLAR